MKISSQSSEKENSIDKYLDVVALMVVAALTE